MRGFEANRCRLCDKVFCCEKCRSKHEATIHQIFPACDICVYGQFLFRNAAETLLIHLKTHLPLHCLDCKKIFNTLEELIQHKICPIRIPKTDSPKLIEAQNSIFGLEEDQDSPLFQELQKKEKLHFLFNLATSTPMQGSDNNRLFGKSKDSITPVDRPFQKEKKSIIKKDSVSMMKSDKENLSKRRVTFGETPAHNDENKSITTGGTFVTPTETSQQYLQTPATPVTGMSTGQFYSAKSNLGPSRTGNISQSTPKLIGQEKPPHSDIETTEKDKGEESDSNVNESIESCNSPKHLFSKSDVENDSPAIRDTNTPAGDDRTELVEEKLDTSSNQQSKSIDTDTQNKQELNDSDKENNPALANTTEGKTLWMSALNLDESSNEAQSSRIIEEKDQQADKSPEKPSKKRISILIPTPILKRTNVRMMFHIPAGHFSSTPVPPRTGVIEMQKIEGISAKNAQTPFKTPCGEKFFSNYSGITGSPRNELLALPECETHSEVSSQCRQVTESHSYQKDETAELSSTSNTESSLWTSMTRMVKNVFDGFTNLREENTSRHTNSFKRQLSSPDTIQDCLEAPKLKRFKFTDIKCRRPIRNQLALLPQPQKRQMATVEIVKSVSTLYGEPSVRIQCNKATQTDDYLMDGWHPTI